MTAHIPGPAWLFWKDSTLVHLHDAVDLANEPEASEESYRTGQQEEQEHHDQRVAKVQEGRGGVLDLQLGGEVVATVDEQIDRRKAGCQERSPPPVVVLGAQMEIAQQDGRFRAGDDQNQEHQKQKAEHVVHLAGPERVQDEEQLDEDATEWQDAAHDDAGDRLGVDRLVRDLAWDLVGTNRVLQRLQTMKQLKIGNNIMAVGRI